MDSLPISFERPSMRSSKARPSRKRGIWPRKILQAMFFTLVAFISTNHILVKHGGGIAAFPNASLHAICPFGGVESMAQLFITGTLIQHVRITSVLMLDLVIILAVLFGPAFCGWICPLGTIQEWVGQLGKKWHGLKRYNHFIPPGLDQVLRYARYVVLVWVLYVTITSGKLLFQDYDPFFALFHFWTGEVAPTALIILETAVLLSLFVERPWCKYACPFGALLGLTNFIRIFSIRRSEAACRHSGDACSMLCPMNIEISKKTVIRDHQCITCMECTSEACCPVKDAVFLGTGSAK